MMSKTTGNLFIEFRTKNSKIELYNSKILMPRLTREEIEARIAAAGDKLHPDCITGNNKDYIDIICHHCGDVYQTTVNNFCGKKQTRCPCVGKANDKQRRAEETKDFLIYMDAYIIRCGYTYELIGEWKGEYCKNLKLQCPNGHEPYITCWNSFRDTKKPCKQCRQ